MFRPFICLLAIFPAFLGSPSPQRLQLDQNVRGNSFGLENFLLQPYENAETVRVVKTKRVRPRVPTSGRGQTYGLENLSAQVYESSRIIPTQETKRRPYEPTAEANRIKENYVATPETIAHVKTETSTKEVVTERIRKRIMMKRRRKRPSNAENNSEVTGNAILKPVRIPIYPQVSKVVVRTKPTEETVPKVTQETTEEEPTTIVTEKSTTTTTTTTTTTEKPSTINLKTFLKQQTETLSLSELLQTQNLSLADLLRGNKDASAILKARPTIVSTTPVARRKQFGETTSKKMEVIEVTTARASYNGFQPKIPRTKTNPKPEETQRPNLSSAGTEPQNRLSELRLKLRNFQKKSTTPAPEVTVGDETVEPVPSKTTEAPKRVSFKSANNPELSVILPNKVKPERLSNWTNRLPSIKRFGQDRLKQTEPPRIPIITQEEPEEVEEIPTTTPKVEEIRKPEPKDELIELLKSGQNADRLQKILQSRNMTIQELLDNREKPPLQMNISTLFSDQKQISTTTQPTLFDSLPDFNLQQTEEEEEPEAEESAPSIARVLPSREPKQFEFPVADEGVSQLDLQSDDSAPDVSHAEESALWKLSEKSMYYGSSYGYADFPAVQQTEKPKPVKQLTDDDIILLETIRRSQETNRKFKLNLNDFVQEEDQPEAEDIEKSYIPPAVKSAIIASGVVMGIALFVFIAIFAACGWKQRQIRLKSTTGEGKSKRTLSPVSFKDTHSYKKTIDFDDETSDSGTSNTSSYLWNTLKNTFTSRASTLKSRLEKEEKLREDKITLRRNESRRKESRYDDRAIGASGTEEGPTVKKIDRDRNVINTSFNFKRSLTNDNVSHFNECVHGY